MRAPLKTILAKRKVLIPTVAVAAALVLAFLIFVSRSNKPAEAAPRPIDVQVVKVERKDVPIYNEWIGSTEGITNADIKPQVSRYLLPQDYDNAAQANAVSRAQVKAAEAGVDTARAQLRAANAQVITAKATVKATEGQIENAKAGVRTAELNLSFTRIISPIDGIAGLAQAQVGNLVNTQSAALTTVSTVDPIKIYFTLSEQQYLYFNKAGLINARSGASVAQIELE